MMKMIRQGSWQLCLTYTSTHFSQSQLHAPRAATMDSYKIEATFTPQFHPSSSVTNHPTVSLARSSCSNQSTTTLTKILLKADVGHIKNVSFRHGCCITQPSTLCRTRQAYNGGLSGDISFAENEELVAASAVPCIGGRSMPEWRRLVNAIFITKLTYSRDKLIAMGAISQEYRNATQQTYLAGLWKERLPRDLCWHIRSSCPLSPRPHEYRAPSWSWAAVDGEVLTWLFMFGLDSTEVSSDGAEVLEATVNPAFPQATYGAVKGGTVVIKGKMKSVSWYYNRGKLSLSEHQLDGLPDALEDAWSEREDACASVLALLLLKAHASWRDRSEEKRC